MLRSAPVAAALPLPPAAFVVDDMWGYGRSDWCTSQKDGPCLPRRPQARRGMEYRGESVAACRFDKDGYAANCPTVGGLDRRRAPVFGLSRFAQ